MSRTKKGKKGPGYEYWGKRPISASHGAVPGRFTKTRTHKIERKQGKISVQKEMKKNES